MQLFAAIVLSLVMVSPDNNDEISVDYSCAIQNNVQMQQTAPSAMVRIVSRVTKNGMTRSNMGSGTLIDWHGEKFILTASHIFRDGVGTITISSQKRETVAGTLVLQDTYWDVVVLKPNRELDIVPINISDEVATKGDKTTAWGFGGNGQLIGTKGELVGYTYSQKSGTYETLRVTGGARYGDSGGAILNAKNELIGVIWGTDGQSTYATGHLRLQKLLNTLPKQKRKIPRELQTPPLPKSMEMSPAISPYQPLEEPLTPLLPKQPDAPTGSKWLKFGVAPVRQRLFEYVGMTFPPSIIAYYAFTIWYKRRRKKAATTKQTVNNGYAQELNRLYELSGHSLDSDAILGRLYDQRLRGIEESANADVAKFAQQVRKQVGDQFLRIHSSNPAPAE